MTQQEYECNECDYWSVIHGKEDSDPERHKKCAHCMKPIRLEAYKQHWNQRRDYGDQGMG